MEERILLRIHDHAHPWLDSVFRLSHELATVEWCIGLVFVGVIACALRRNGREILLWLSLGFTTFTLQEGLKHAFGRLRPELWESAIPMTTPAFPSGHALAAGTFYPLLRRELARWRPELRPAAFALAALLVLYVGFGRLYLGVHWPTDVIGGWTIGALQTGLGIHIAERSTQAGRALRN